MVTNLRPDDPRADQDDREVIGPIVSQLCHCIALLRVGREYVNNAEARKAMHEAADELVSVLDDTNGCGLDIVNARINEALAAEDEADTEGLKRAHEAGVRR